MSSFVLANNCIVWWVDDISSLRQMNNWICVDKLSKYYLPFIHSGYFNSTSSSPLLLRGASDTAQILCWNFTPKHHRELWVKDLLKVPTWRLERESNSWPFGRRALTLPKRHHVPPEPFYFFIFVSTVSSKLCARVHPSRETSAHKKTRSAHPSALNTYGYWTHGVMNSWTCKTYTQSLWKHFHVKNYSSIF